VILTFVIVTFFTLLTEFVTILTVYTVNGEKFDFFFFFRANTLYGLRALTLYGYYVSFALSAVSTVCSHGRQPRGTPGPELLRATL
jgi:hypothetical protein